MNKQVDQLLQQRMDRKNFLKNVALGVVMMSGAASLVKVLNHPQHGQSGSNPMAYGGSAYGGVKPPSAQALQQHS